MNLQHGRVKRIHPAMLVKAKNFSPPGWMGVRVAVRIHRMAMVLNRAGGEVDESARLLQEAISKATALLDQLLGDQAQLELPTTRMSHEAMFEMRASLQETITAVRQTIESLRETQSAAGVEPEIATVAIDH